jgi:tRNA (guanine-N1)-methyltransferase
MLKIDVLTIFPEFFREVFDFGIIRRAKIAEIVEINVYDIRAHSDDKHRMVDDRPFGGGDGMVLKCQPIFTAIENLTGTAEQRRRKPRKSKPTKPKRKEPNKRRLTRKKRKPRTPPPNLLKRPKQAKRKNRQPKKTNRKRASKTGFRVETANN